jgi:hypothetical protein
MPHDGHEFGVFTGERFAPLLLTFKRRLIDKIGPAIPSDVFAGMKKIELDTTKARGSFSGPPPGPCFGRVTDPPELIFTKTSDYEVQIGPALGGYDPYVTGECRVRYIDTPRPAPGRSSAH